MVVEREGQKALQLPMHAIGGIVCFGNVLCSPFLIGAACRKGYRRVLPD